MVMVKAEINLRARGEKQVLPAPRRGTGARSAQADDS
jgi:hypothetical protein